MLKVVQMKRTDLVPYPNNPRDNDDGVDAVANSIREFGFQQPIVVDKNNVVIVGHTRLKAAERLGLEKVPVVVADLSEEKANAYRLADNKTGELSRWDFSALQIELENIEMDMEQFGFQPIDFHEINLYEDTMEQDSLQRDFIAPPFSVLDGRQGYWRERKKAWRELIKEKGQARDVAIIDSNINRGEEASILDPVLAEIILKWYTPAEGSSVFDCFAGDTVFGYVASDLGHNFTGIEIRQEQADFNNERVEGKTARYICDDGRNVDRHIEEGSQDFFFSCPPYYDLEVYSDDPNDASNQATYEEFYAILDEAFTKSISRLKDNRFAAIVVANIRDKDSGSYYNFVGDVIETFRRNGMLFYNDMILLDPIGSAGIRARKSMAVRKVVKVHQNVLVFYKGDQKRIKDIFPKIEVRIDEGENE